MGRIEDLNAFAAQNPGDAYASPNAGQRQEPEGDPLVAQIAGADPGVQAPVSAGYTGLTGEPFQTALITTAQLEALRPRRRPTPRPAVPPTPFAGLSSFLRA